jgi:7-cyano-7-deazaguanine reductase
MSKDNFCETTKNVKHKKNPELNALGSDTKYEFKYNKDLLETFKNKHTDQDYLVTLECLEFTSLCPVTGQPDWATIFIRYIPDEDMVESKSLKLYLNSFRNQGDFHEDIINIIMKDLRDVMQPRYIEVLGVFNPRGGIAIHPFTAWGCGKYRQTGPAMTYAEYAVHRTNSFTIAELTQVGKHLR